MPDRLCASAANPDAAENARWAEDPYQLICSVRTFPARQAAVSQVPLQELRAMETARETAGGRCGWPRPIRRHDRQKKRTGWQCRFPVLEKSLVSPGPARAV